MPRKNATRIVRDRWRGMLKEEFKGFLEDATKEEVMFLYDVLMQRRSVYNYSGGEVAIACAFEDCIRDRGRQYFHFEDDGDGKLSMAVKKLVEKWKDKAKPNGKLLLMGGAGA